MPDHGVIFHFGNGAGGGARGCCQRAKVSLTITRRESSRPAAGRPHAPQPGSRGGALAPGTMPGAAGVAGDRPVPAVGAGLDVIAQRSGAAVLDGRHDQP